MFGVPILKPSPTGLNQVGAPVRVPVQVGASVRVPVQVGAFVQFPV